MTSHRYEFTLADVLRLLLPPLAPVALFAVLMHAGVALCWLPAPRPTLDVDRTVLVHQVEASRMAQPAEILLLGDSSCLMDVDARQLGELLGCRVLNLATLSYLDLNAQTALLREYVAAHPDRLRTIVLLLHPEALRRVGPEAWHMAFFDSLLNEYDFRWGTGVHARLCDALGLEICRGRVVCRVVPNPLPGAYGRFYGFSDDLDQFLTAHDGSAVDPDARAFRGSPEYRLATQLEGPSRNLRAAIPSGVKLFAGITPAPAGYAGARFPATRDAMLRQWAEWLTADAALDNLPATQPDDLFARTTHLNTTGAEKFTQMLAEALR
jgi:hypothetical protein